MLDTKTMLRIQESGPSRPTGAASVEEAVAAAEVAVEDTVVEDIIVADITEDTTIQEDQHDCPHGLSFLLWHFSFFC